MEAAGAQATTLNPETAPLGVDEDDDDEYEPDYYLAEDTEQILNKLDSDRPEREAEAAKAQTATLALGAFRLPPPRSLDPELAAKVGQGTVSRVFGIMQSLDDLAVKKPRPGLNRLAGSSADRDAWITVITRLATRSTAGLEGEDDTLVKLEDGNPTRPASLGTAIRDALFAYVLEDFRKRIDVAVAWLCEEWYNDKTQGLYDGDVNAPLHYDKWMLKLIDGFLPYLHPQDKVLTRFLGEIPDLNTAVMARVKNLCRDPSMVPLALTSLLYLVMMRPPVRGLALDTVQDIWTECEYSIPFRA